MPDLRTVSSKNRSPHS